MRLLLGILLAIAILLEFGAIVDSFTQPSDQEIRDSFVDTWDPSAIVAMAVLVILLAVSVIAIVALVASPGTRTVSVLLLACSVAVGIHWTLNHIELSVRAEAITGIEIGGFYGLF